MPEVPVNLAWLWIALALVTGVVLMRVTAPYGRHRRSGWGPTIPQRVGWVVMESVSPVALLFALDGPIPTWSMVLAGCWVAHYVYRALVYPFRARWKGRRMPAAIAVMATVFNGVNGTLNGIALSLTEPRPALVAVGLTVFAIGLAINLHSDAILLRLRRAGAGGYSVPHGGLFRLVSAPNYLGEIIEWTGFAIAAWNVAALSFAVWTAANLVPRALANHRWYRQRFEDYPANRKALLPGIL